MTSPCMPLRRWRPTRFSKRTRPLRSTLTTLKYGIGYINGINSIYGIDYIYNIHCTYHLVCDEHSHYIYCTDRIHSIY